MERAFSFQSCLYGSGKFEKQSQSKPHTALVQHVAGARGRAALRGPSVASCKEALKGKLKEEELSTLVEVFLNIKSLVEIESLSSDQAPAVSSRSKEGLEQLKCSL